MPGAGHRQNPHFSVRLLMWSLRCDELGYRCQRGRDDEVASRWVGGPNAGVMRNSAFVGNLVWSPDGRRLAFGLGYVPYRIHVVGSDGSGLTRLIAKGAHPEWSSDGSRIAYD